MVLTLAACATSRSLVLTSNISVNGTEYDGGPATAFHISDSDAKSIGDAQDINAEVNGNTAFQLNGVDPKNVVVMKARDASEAAYWIFFRQGALPSPAGQDVDWSFPTIPGLCHYLSDPPSTCG